MPQHITTEDAKKQQVPGFDVYRYSHLLYNSDLSRDVGVVRLNLEALRAFSDTVTISQRKELEAEQAAVKQWLAQDGLQRNLPFPWGSASLARMSHMNLEHLKIASGFELHLKARLLARDYVLHEIDWEIPAYKQLASQQRQRPIEKRELFAIQPYHFDGKLNYLPGLREGSLKFSWLTEKTNYKTALGLSTQQLDIIEDYRLLRNQIHLPGDIVEDSRIQGLAESVVDFLIEFINSEIVAWSNELIAKHKMNHRPIAIFT